jgi:Zn-finger in Ran binding protein and others.
MRTRAYRWVCHKCESANDPGSSRCSACGFPAIATAVEIARARGEPNPVSEGYKSTGRIAGWFTYVLALVFPW